MAMETPTLEALPVELKIQVLKGIRDCKSLISLICASRVYYQLYIAYREEIDFCLVENLYIHVDIAEALAAVRSAGLHAEVESNIGAILTLLDQRRRPNEIQNVHGSNHPFNPVSHDECINLLRLHTKLSGLIDSFCLTAPSPPWLDDDAWKADELPLRLSELEEARFLRALYRIQTYCNIFGVREIPLGADEFGMYNEWTVTSFDADEMWGLFFGTMPPWEVEELTCVWIYLCNQYDDIFKDLTGSLPLGYMLSTHVSSDALGAEFSEPQENNIFYFWYLNHMVSMGPAFLHKLHQEEDIERRHGMIYQNIGGYRDGFMLFVDEFASPCPLTSPADVYERGIFPPLLSGLGPMEQPNAAWGWFYDRFYRTSNQEVVISLRRGLGSFQIREWGYALWDTRRLLGWDAFNHLMDDGDEAIHGASF